MNLFNLLFAKQRAVRKLDLNWLVFGLCRGHIFKIFFGEFDSEVDIDIARHGNYDIVGRVALGHILAHVGFGKTAYVLSGAEYISAVAAFAVMRF